MAGLVRREKFDVVILDTLASMSPIRNENDAAEMMAALMPLRALNVAGAAVLLIHHPRKGDAGEGQAARGSGALSGFVDVIMELRRFDASRREDARRKLTTYSRFDESPDERVIELTDDGYVDCGTRHDANRLERFSIYQKILPAQSPGLTPDEIRNQWPEMLDKPSVKTIKRDLAEPAPPAQG